MLEVWLRRAASLALALVLPSSCGARTGLGALETDGAVNPGQTTPRADPFFCRKGDPPTRLFALDDGSFEEMVGWPAVALSDDEVFFSTSPRSVQADSVSHIRRVSKRGGPSAVVVETTGAFASSLAALAGGADVFYALFGTEAPRGDIRHVSADGIVQVLATEQYRPNGIAVDDQWVYWTVGNTDGHEPSSKDGEVRRVVRGGGVPTAIATGQQSPWAIALAGDRAVWTNNASESGWDDGNLASSAKSGGDVATLASKTGIALFMALDSSDAYFAPDDGQKAVLQRVALGGGSATTYDSIHATIGSIAVDATHIYYVGSDNFSSSAIVVRAKDGGDEATFIDKPEAVSLAVDQDCLYFATAHELWKTPLASP